MASRNSSHGKSPVAKVLLATLLAAIAVFIIIGFYDWTPPKPNDDAFFFRLATSTQSYYQSQTVALGISMTHPLSKSCYQNVSGIGASNTGVLYCEISTSFTVPANTVYSKSYVQSMLAKVSPILKNEGFVLANAAQITVPNSSDIPMVWAQTPGNICSTILYFVEPQTSANTGPALDYQLRCDAYAQDTPRGFTYDSTPRNY